jgi:hypothetical protein
MIVKTFTNRRLAILALVLIPVLACSPLGGLLGGGGGGTVANLWPDVPQYPGSEKIDAELPLAVRLLVEGMTRAVTAETQSEGDGQLEAFDFITYETPDGTEDVGAFYTFERMSSRGWTARVEGEQAGCSDAAPGDTSVGTLCLFGQEAAGDVSALFIMAIPVEETNRTRIYYIRIAGTKGDQP